MHVRTRDIHAGGRKLTKTSTLRCQSLCSGDTMSGASYPVCISQSRMLYRRIAVGRSRRSAEQPYSVQVNISSPLTPADGQPRTRSNILAWRWSRRTGRQNTAATRHCIFPERYRWGRGYLPSAKPILTPPSVWPSLSSTAAHDSSPRIVGRPASNDPPPFGSRSEPGFSNVTGGPAKHRPVRRKIPLGPRNESTIRLCVTPANNVGSSP